MSQSRSVFVSIKGHVLCLDPASGEERWRTKLRRKSISPIVDLGDIVVCYCGGHLYGLAKESGDILWENKLPGLGHGYCLIAGDSAQQAANTAIAAAIASQQAATAAAG